MLKRACSYLPDFPFFFRTKKTTRPIITNPPTDEETAIATISIVFRPVLDDPDISAVKSQKI